MRIVEEEMVMAVRSHTNFKKGNTQVVCKADGTINVYLFGNNICRVLPNGRRLFSNCGWKSNTTKTRLNALGANIVQKNFEWYKADGTEWQNDNF